jgi:magnesium chelatase subunit D
VFDTSPEAFRLAAQTTAQMLEVVTGHRVILVTLGTFEAEDDLWGSLGLCGESGEQPFQWKQGLLRAGQKDSQLRLVVIPDLTKLSLAAARACVVLMGADVAHLERHGQQAQWQPNLCWLAGCAISEVGMVSPHLLDRFALRLSERITKTTDRAAEILEWIDDQRLGEETKPEPLPTEISDRLKKALQFHPTITAQAIARILDYTPMPEVYPRREIALARLSLANARLEGGAEMTAEHVDAAAQMIGLKPVAKRTEEPANLTSEPVTPQPDLPKPTDATPILAPSLLDQPEPSTVREPVYESDEPEPLSTTRLMVDSALINPYPEDEAPVEREAASLRLPPRWFRTSAAARGSIIGVEKATTLQDLALVRTLLEAAKFQPIRQQSTPNGQRRLVLSPTDLHCYRRAPVAEQMLMLVLDHTCLRDCNWQEELLPYLSWAYVERASVCLIQVGASDARHELRAERVMAQSILVPQCGN